MFYQYIENKCWFRIKPVADKASTSKTFNAFSGK